MAFLVQLATDFKVVVPASWKEKKKASFIRSYYHFTVSRTMIASNYSRFYLPSLTDFMSPKCLYTAKSPKMLSISSEQQYTQHDADNDRNTSKCRTVMLHS